MTGFILRRLLISLIILWAVYTSVFLLIRVAPGDPAQVALGDYASKEAVEALRERMGLNRSLWTQYVSGLQLMVCHGDLGTSLINGRPISSQVARALPYTIELAVAGILIGTLVGVPWGVVTAVRRNRWPDYAGRVLSLIGVSVPEFYLGLVLMLIFAVRFPVFPVIGGGDLTDAADSLRHLVLPATTLGAIMIAYITRITRSTMLNVLKSDYVRTAEAKGLSNTKVIFKHALKNALVPVAATIGIFCISLIGGSVLVEVVFTRNGLGRMMVGAMQQRDYIMVQSIMVLYGFFVALVNTATEIAYRFVDPTIRY